VRVPVANTRRSARRHRRFRMSRTWSRRIAVRRDRRLGVNFVGLAGHRGGPGFAFSTTPAHRNASKGPRPPSAQSAIHTFSRSGPDHLPICRQRHSCWSENLLATACNISCNTQRLYRPGGVGSAAGCRVSVARAGRGIPLRRPNSNVTSSPVMSPSRWRPWCSLGGVPDEAGVPLS
jgi:hypothetical protein